MVFTPLPLLSLVPHKLHSSIADLATMLPMQFMILVVLLPVSCCTTPIITPQALAATSTSHWLTFLHYLLLQRDWLPMHLTRKLAPDQLLSPANRFLILLANWPGRKQLRPPLLLTVLPLSRFRPQKPCWFTSRSLFLIGPAILANTEHQHEMDVSLNLWSTDQFSTLLILRRLSRSPCLLLALALPQLPY